MVLGYEKAGARCHNSSSSFNNCKIKLIRLINIQLLLYHQQAKKFWSNSKILSCSGTARFRTNPNQPRLGEDTLIVRSDLLKQDNYTSSFMYRGKLNFCGTYSYVTLQLNLLCGQGQTEPKTDVLPGLQNRKPSDVHATPGSVSN